MSVSIERSQLVHIAQSVYVGSLEIEAHLKKSLKRKPIASIFNQVEEKLWRINARKHPFKGIKDKTTSTVITIELRK